MNSNIIDKLLTTEDTRNILHAVDQLRTAVYQVHEGSIEKVLQSDVPVWFAEEIRKILPSDSAQQEALFHDLEKEIRALSKVQLVLAFEPSRSTVIKLHKWFSNDLGKSLVLDLQFDPTLLGGVVVVIDGSYHDLTIKQELKEVVTEEVRKEVFTEVQSGKSTEHVIAPAPAEATKTSAPPTPATPTQAQEPTQPPATNP